MPSGYAKNGVNKGQFKKGCISIMKGKHHTKESIEKISKNSSHHVAWNKGLTIEDPRVAKIFTKERADKISKTSTGRKHTKESKGKISKANMGKNNGMYGIKQSKETINKRIASTQKVESKRRKHISKTFKEPIFNKKFRNIMKVAMARPEVREKYINSTIHRKFCDMKPEILIYNVVVNAGYKIEKQFFIKGVGIVDFYLPDYNTIIEVFGDFWHANPKKYKPNHIIFKNKKIKAKHIWNKDSKRIGNAKKLGYKIIVLWEKNITNNINSCIKKINKIGGI